MSRPHARTHRLEICLVAATGAALLFMGAPIGRAQTAKAAPKGGAPVAVDPLPTTPPTFDTMASPPDNPTTPEKAALGRMLFFDKRLSGDGRRSCYSCHLNEHGLTDGRPTAVGAFGKPLTRNSPTLWNIGYHRELYWGGRSDSLEGQAMAAWKGANMGANPDQAVRKIADLPGYRKRFQEVFGGPATPDTVVKAIAAFERTILCGDTRYDRYEQGEASAMNEQEIRGFEIFKGKGSCTNCHVGSLLTDTLYHNVGVGMSLKEPDVGRKKVTKEEKDTGAFKTPTLRDITRTAPYFHNGSVKTLEEAVDVMARGGIDNPFLDREKLADRNLTTGEKSDLVAFLHALECPGRLETPKLP